MVAPSGEGAVSACKCVKGLMDCLEMSCINAHGTSTPAGDSKELIAVNEVFGPSNKLPYLSSTKSLTGHSLGATGVQELIIHY